jgi:hypothetical protein
MPEGQTPFSIRYVGTVPEALQAHELIQVLSALNRLSLKASRTFYGSEAQTTFRIAHVQSGSIDIQGFVELIAGLQPAFAQFPNLILSVHDIPELIKTWLDLLKFLGGQQPKLVQNVDNGNALAITNNHGQVQQINGNIYNTFIFNNVGQEAAKLDAPIKHGAESLELLRGKRKIATYKAKDVAQFKPIRPANAPVESEIDAILEVTAPVLEGEGVWRFKYGRMSLTAKVADDNFRQQVLDGTESFRHGDRLRVQLRTIQENLGDKITTRHYITKVIGRL